MLREVGTRAWAREVAELWGFDVDIPAWLSCQLRRMDSKACETSNKKSMKDSRQNGEV